MPQHLPFRVFCVTLFLLLSGFTALRAQDPDLRVTSVIAPHSAASGTIVSIQYTITNASVNNMPKSALFSQAYLSIDTLIGNDDDISLLPAAIDTAIAAGESCTGTMDIFVPVVSGSYHVAVVVNSPQFVTESDYVNNTGFSDIMNIDLKRPDLTITDFVVLEDATSGRPVRFSYILRNNGEADATGLYWVDGVFLMSDSLFATDLQIGSVIQLTGLAAGESREIIDSAYPGPGISPGTYFLGIRANASGNIHESNDSNNTAVSNAFAIGKNGPDLVVASITVPATGFSGREIEISWQVNNAGGVATSVPAWYDVVYLSPNPVFDSAASIRLGNFANVSYLAPGLSYSNTQRVTIPDGIAGTYYIAVVTDGFPLVAEIDETNNRLISTDSIRVTLSPSPDLRIADLMVPGVVFSGDTALVTFRITNKGDVGTGGSPWFDYVYFSLDSIFSTTSAFVVGVESHSGIVEPESSYTVTTNAVLPYAIHGHGYIYLVTDFLNAVYEFTGESNNVRRSALIEVPLTPPPDLAVTSVIAPHTGASSAFANVAWSVRNEGQTATHAYSWHDRVYLSRSQTFAPESAYVIGTFEHNGYLDADSGYSRAEPVRLPDGFDGIYYVFVKADWEGKVFENEITENNIARADLATAIALSPWADLAVGAFSVPAPLASGQRVTISWTVNNIGTAATTVPSWSDRVYFSTHSTFDEAAVACKVVPVMQPVASGTGYSESVVVELPSPMPDSVYFYLVVDADDVLYEHGSEENNISRSAKMAVFAPPAADLTLSALTVPVSGISGNSLGLSYAVSNSGAGATLAPRWIDAVYFSVDTVFLRGQRILIGAVARTERLEPGEGYLRETHFSIPDGLSGTYYVAVITDTDRAMNESNRFNNMRIASSAITISAPATADLRIADATGPSTLLSGSMATVTWTVANTANVPTKDTSWNDVVYLSSDRFVDIRDLRLVTKMHRGPLAGNGMYSDTAEVIAPEYLSGNVFLLFETDSHKDVYEGVAGEKNNVFSQLIEVIAAPPSDLVVGGIEAPDTVVAGAMATVSWELGNEGPNTASGFVTDAVYVSADSVWDVNDPLIGVSERTISIEPGGRQRATLRADIVAALLADSSGSVSAPFPGVASGTYHIFVRTDIRNTIPEVREDNNSTMAATATSVSLRILQLGVGGFGSLSLGQSIYYRIDNVPAGQTMNVALTSGDAGASHELYLKYGSVPTRGSFDLAFSQPFSRNQDVFVPETHAGSYYVLIYGDQIPGDHSDYKINAKLVQYSVTSVAPQRGGNTGEVTIIVSGARFTPGTTVRLVGPGGAEPHLVQILSATSSRIEATFDLTRNAPLGNYDVVVQKPDLSTASLTAGFTVEPGTAFSADLGFVPPTSILFGGSGFYAVNIQNTSNIDLPFLTAWIVIPGGTEYTVNTDRLLTYTGSLPDSLRVKYRVLDAIDNDGWRFIPLTALHVRAGEKLSIALQVNHVEGEEFPIQVFADALSRKQFIDHQLITIELARQGVLVAPDSVVDSGLKQLAEHPADFTMAVMQTYVSLGYLTPEDLAGITQSAISQAQHRSMLLPKTGPANRRYGQSMRCTDKLNLAFLGIDAVKVVAGAFGLVLAPVTGGASLVMFAVSVASLGMDAQNFINGKSGLLSNLFCGKDPRTPTRIVRSKDPNDLQGPAGYGDKRWVGVTQSLPYTIQFENDPKFATAPAHVVRVTLPLDSTADPRSFRLGHFGFGKYLFGDALGRSTFSTRIDLRDSLGIFVDVVAGADIANRRAFWTFTTIDPATGVPPVDPTKGFLKVNDSTRRGEGFVTFSMRARATAKTGNLITAKARIVFDINDPLETPSAFNTIDAGIPSSRVSHTGRIAGTNDFKISWQGKDDSTGSGLNTYSVFVSVDDSAYTSWVNGSVDTGFVFHGLLGHRYRLYTLAIDHAGNVEPGKITPDAEIILTGVENAGPGIPKEYTLSQNYPNPFNPMTVIEYSLPVASNVHLAIYNLLGQQVQVLADDEHQSAGFKRAVWNASSVASGIYFYRLQATGIAGSGHRTYMMVRKMSVVK